MNAATNASDMAQRLARLEAVQSVVLDISRRSARRGDLRTFYQAVHHAIARIMHARSFCIALHDAKAKGVRYVYRIDEKDACPPPGKLFPLQPEDESPTSWVIRRGEPLCITIDQIAKRAKKGTRWGTGAYPEHWLGMPLIGNDGVTFGAIVVQEYEPGFRYSDEDIALFELMSEHVADAIEKVQFAAHLEQAIAERTRSLEIEVEERRHAEKLQRTLYEISALTVKDIDLDKFYAGLHRILGELMYAKNLSIMLYYNDERDLVGFPYSADERDEELPANYRRPAGHGLTGFVMRTRMPQRIDQQRFQALVESGAIHHVLGCTDFNVWMGAPMIHQGKVLGVILLQSYDPAISYDDDDLKLLSFVADHIAAALSRKQANDALRAAHANLADGSAALQAKNRELETTLMHLGMAQSELVRQEKLASLGELVAGIAHDVNTPLGICVTAVSHLAEETAQIRRTFDDSKLTEGGLRDYFESTDEVLRILTDNIQRASGLIRSFKQVAVDQLSDDIREIALAKYIDETLRSLRPKLKKTKHAIEVSCDPELRVRSAPGALSQILTNLVINSIVHGFENIEEGRIWIAAQGDQTNLTIDYRDNGCGMSPDALKRLFDPFYTTKRGRGGSGLGANIIYNLVTSKLGGSVKVDSSPGQGLHYSIRLPILAP
ncbi:MAG: GAF domain-containing protein [Lysobacteraceae bacterium]